MWNDFIDKLDVMTDYHKETFTEIKKELTVLGLTEKAVKLEEYEEWLPLSQLKVDPDGESIYMANWLYEKYH